MIHIVAKKTSFTFTELFRRYEAASDRIFSDDVFAAELEDIDYANAFLLGMDVGMIAKDEEFGILSAFLQDRSISDEDLLDLDREDIQQREALQFQKQLRAFGDREEPEQVN